MYSVRMDRHRHVAIEVYRDERRVHYIKSNDGAVVLLNDSVDAFQQEFRMYAETSDGAPYSPQVAARKFLDYNYYSSITVPALLMMARVLSAAHGAEGAVAPEATLLELQSMRVIGQFDSYMDCRLVAGKLPYATQIVCTPTSLEDLDDSQLLQLQNGLDPANALGVMPAEEHLRSTFIQELFAMTQAAAVTDATQQTGAAAGASTAAPAAAPRADGPVAIVKALYDTLEKELRAGTKTRKDALNAAVAKNINIATATTQYGLWAKAKNIQTVRAQPTPSPEQVAKKAAAEKEKADKAKAKEDAKAAKAKEKEAADKKAADAKTAADKVKSTEATSKGTPPAAKTAAAK